MTVIAPTRIAASNKIIFQIGARVWFCETQDIFARNCRIHPKLWNLCALRGPKSQIWIYITVTLKIQGAARCEARWARGDFPMFTLYYKIHFHKTAQGTRDWEYFVMWLRGFFSGIESQTASLASCYYNQCAHWNGKSQDIHFHDILVCPIFLTFEVHRSVLSPISVLQPQFGTDNQSNEFPELTVSMTVSSSFHPTMELAQTVRAYNPELCIHPPNSCVVVCAICCVSRVVSAYAYSSFTQCIKTEKHSCTMTIHCVEIFTQIPNYLHFLEFLGRGSIDVVELGSKFLLKMRDHEVGKYLTTVCFCLGWKWHPNILEMDRLNIHRFCKASTSRAAEANYPGSIIPLLVRLFL